MEVVIHDADYDLRILAKHHGIRVENVFDTLVAAELVNEPEIGLAALLGKYQGLQIDKRFQKADWSKRPLPQPMLDYAAGDTTSPDRAARHPRGEIAGQGALGMGRGGVRPC